jgi:Zn-dependent protease with chaperone function
LLLKANRNSAANAFALPNGRVVVTDELVELLKNDSDALRAVLLHEIGHVQHHHSIRLAAQAAVSNRCICSYFW